MGKIKVEIKEDYKGAQWYHVTIDLPGYGTGPDGINYGKFVLVPLRDVLACEDVLDTPLFRPEYAKAIESALNNVEV